MCDAPCMHSMSKSDCLCIYGNDNTCKHINHFVSELWLVYLALMTSYSFFPTLLMVFAKLSLSPANCHVPRTLLPALLDAVETSRLLLWVCGRLGTTIMHACPNDPYEDKKTITCTKQGHARWKEGFTGVLSYSTLASGKDSGLNYTAYSEFSMLCNVILDSVYRICQPLFHWRINRHKIGMFLSACHCFGPLMLMLCLVHTSCYFSMQEYNSFSLVWWVTT